MSLHRLPEPDDNWRSVPFMPDIDPDGLRFQTSQRDPVEKVPVGTFIAMVFRVTGFDPDCDGSLMARLEHVDRHGSPSGWEVSHIGLYEDYDVVLDSPSDLHDLRQGTSHER